MLRKHNTQVSDNDLKYIEPVSKPSRTVSILLAIALCIVAISIAIFLKWSFADDDILTINNSPFPVRTVRDGQSSGGIVILNVDYCKKYDIDGKVRTSFVSSTSEVFLPISTESSSKGCIRHEVPVLIPKGLTPDTYKIKFYVTYDINPLKNNVVKQFETREFVLYK